MVAPLTLTVISKRKYSLTETKLRYTPKLPLEAKVAEKVREPGLVAGMFCGEPLPDPLGCVPIASPLPSVRMT